jgi:hypothetical protein
VGTTITVGLTEAAGVPVAFTVAARVPGVRPGVDGVPEGVTLPAGVIEGAALVGLILGLAGTSVAVVAGDAWVVVVGPGVAVGVPGVEGRGLPVGVIASVAVGLITAGLGSGAAVAGVTAGLPEGVGLTAAVGLPVGVAVRLVAVGETAAVGEPVTVTWVIVGPGLLACGEPVI